MVITITMRNVRLRNGIYEFRMAVPADCQDSVGHKEITQSLKTSDAAQADVLAKELTSEWKRKFKAIRTGKSLPPAIKAKTNDTLDDFKAKLAAHMNQHLDDYLLGQSEDDLVKNSEWLMECMAKVKNGDDTPIDLSEELGITLPLPVQKSPGLTRRLNKSVIDALTIIRESIDTEAGWKVSEKVEMGVMEHVPKASPPALSSSIEQKAGAVDKESGIIDVMNLMLKAKNTEEKYKERIEAEIACLIEWFDGKSDITQFNKADMVDYVNNCLPYIPKNMAKQSAYKGKSLKECVKLVKSDPDKYTPIAHKTCVNRFVGIQTVLGYAKDQLGLITMNPADGIDIPVVRIVAHEDREFSKDELFTIWEKIVPEAHAAVDKYAERYWSTILSLYHGFQEQLK